jgi:hypothetical protein
MTIRLYEIQYYSDEVEEHQTVLGQVLLSGYIYLGYSPFNGRPIQFLGTPPSSVGSQGNSPFTGD